MSDKEQRIRARAYEIYEQDGRHDGRAEEHWQQAKREIEHALASAQAQAAEAPAQPPNHSRRTHEALAETDPDGCGCLGGSGSFAETGRKPEESVGSRQASRGQSEVGPNALAPSAAGLRRTASKTRFRGRRP